MAIEALGMNVLVRYGMGCVDEEGTVVLVQCRVLRKATYIEPSARMKAHINLVRRVIWSLRTMNQGIIAMVQS